MAQEYWLKREGKMYGPYSGGSLKKLASEGKISPSDQISADKQSWQLAEMVRGLSLRATVKPPQAASATVAPPPLEVAPRTGTVSRTHNQQPSLSRYEQRFPPRPSHTKWIVIGVTGVGLAIAIAVWLWMPPNWSITSEELAQSNDNSQPDARSPGKPAPMVKPVAKPAPVARPVAKPTPVARPVAKPKPVAKPVANPKPVAKALTPVQAVADDVCRVTSQHYLKAGLPVAGMAFGSSLQEVVQQNGWRLGKRAEGSRDNGKLLTLHAVMSDWPRESAKRFCWYSNDEDATKVEHPRFTMLLFDNGKLRGIHRRYYYMFDTNDEYEKKHVRQVFQMFGVAKKENTKTGRTPAGQSFISMIHWFPKSLVFLVYTQNSDLALWVFDRQWFKTGLAAHLEEHHAMLLLATKVTKARPRFSPARSRSPASVLPTAKGFKRKISGPKSEGDSWCVEYAPSDSPQSGPRTPSFKLLIPSTVEQMQSKNPFARMRVWNIRFRVEDYDEDLSWALWNTAAGRAGLFGIAFQKLFLRHFPVVTKLEGKNYRTKDGFIANWWNYELYYSPPLPPDPSRGL